MNSNFVAFVEDRDQTEFTPELYKQVLNLMGETRDTCITSPKEEKAYIDVTLPDEAVEDLMAKLKAMGVVLQPAPEAALMEPIPVEQMLP